MADVFCGRSKFQHPDARLYCVREAGHPAEHHLTPVYLGEPIADDWEPQTPPWVVPEPERPKEEGKGEQLDVTV